MTTAIRIAHGTWRQPETVADLPGRATALLSICPPGSIISGLTAARLHELWLPRCPDGPVEVIVHPDQPVGSRRAHSRRPELTARRQIIRPGDLVLIEGLPTLSAARTWLDLSTRLSMPDLIAAGDSALRGSTTLAALAHTVARAGRTRGVVKARAALDLLDPRSRSRPESHLRYAIRSAGLPAPAVNRQIFDEHGDWLAEPDLSYEDVRLAIEYNGIEHADVKRTRRDITRELDVDERGGWATVVFGPSEVFGRPDLIPITIGRLRRERYLLHARLSGASIG